MSSDSFRESPGSAKLRVRLARLKHEAEEKAQRRQMEMELRKLEIEAETKVRLRRLELELQTQLANHSARGVDERKDSGPDRLDISKCITLLPPFRETEVDSYFTAFECLAHALSWPREVWPLLLQCKLCGKAQEVISSLSTHDGTDYDKVKEAVLKAYELVPEAYRQKFRTLRKRNETQTYVEFAREKNGLFDKWLMAAKASSFSELKELLLLEEFKRCLPEKLVLYLNEQKVSTLSAAALSADEFALTHRLNTETKFKRPTDSKLKAPEKQAIKSLPRCFYCHQLGHIAKDCLILKRKNERRESPPREVGFLSNPHNLQPEGQNYDKCFTPFVLEGTAALISTSAIPVKILRDIGNSHSLVLKRVLPFGKDSYSGVSVLLKGLNSENASFPLHEVMLDCGLAKGRFSIAVSDTLPISGVDLLLGNDIAGGLVTPLQKS
uniref:CCHC-type domain-containing protein n=1 Tax=Nothobranchius furzeri TaxID=105023 RepID=A0A8C6KFK7_NOTFU